MVRRVSVIFMGDGSRDTVVDDEVVRFLQAPSRGHVVVFTL